MLPTVNKIYSQKNTYIYIQCKIFSTDRRRSHVTGTAERIARNRRRTGRIGSPVEYLARVKTEDRRAIIVDRRTWSVQQLGTYGLPAGLASYYANWSSQHPRRGEFAFFSLFSNLLNTIYLPSTPLIDRLENCVYILINLVINLFMALVE